MPNLDGYKTYITAAALAVTGVLYGFELINDQVFQAIFALLTAGGLAALRSGVKKTEDKVNEQEINVLIDEIKNI